MHSSRAGEKMFIETSVGAFVQYVDILSKLTYSI